MVKEVLKYSEQDCDKMKLFFCMCCGVAYMCVMCEKIKLLLVMVMMV
jgi:hypothetical protein